jgi:hypothetical protein
MPCLGAWWKQSLNKRLSTSRSFVLRLLFRCSPFAVFRRIAAIIVNSFNRMNRTRTATHIFNECGEAVTPSIAYRYSPVTIVFVTLIAGILASSNHRTPDHVFIGRLAIACIAVSNCSPAKLLQFTQEAAATPNLTALKVLALYNVGTATIALAIPHRAPSRANGLGGSDQSAESLTGQVSKRGLPGAVYISGTHQPIVVHRTQLAPNRAASKAVSNRAMSSLHS